MITNTAHKLNRYRMLSIFVFIFGIVLLSYMIVVEDEPGAIPLLLMLTGTGGFFWFRNEIHSKQS